MRQDVYNNLSLQERRFALLLADRYTKSDQVRIGKALDLATEVYEGIFRNDGQPLIIHYLRVAIILIEHEETNADIIIAALLKDICIYRPELRLVLRDQFGNCVRELIERIEHPIPLDMSDDVELVKKQINPKKYRWFITDATIDECKLKSAEIIDNMRCWPFIAPDHPSRKKFARWCDEARLFFVGIAEKAGTVYADTVVSIIDEYKTMPQFHDFLQTDITRL
jgi:(p)ppGpp synthase/HD superfamily hydrolase